MITLKKSVAVVIRRHYSLLILAYVISDVWRRLKYRLNMISTVSGTRHKSKNVDESCDYIEEVFYDYKLVSGREGFSGKVAELGSGDSDGVGLCFAMDGCDHVHLTDRFFSVRDERQQSHILNTILQRHISDSGVGLIKEELLAKITRFYGAPASAEEFFTHNKGYDYIVSRAVLEHLYDPLKAVSSMIDALNADGMLLHKVDLRDHGLFSPEYHELTFFRLPTILYRQMTKGSGRPNRITLDKYVDLLDLSGLNYEILVTRLVGVGEIRPYRTWEDIEKEKRDVALNVVSEFKIHMAHELQNIPECYLAVSGFFLIAAKPG